MNLYYQYILLLLLIILGQWYLNKSIKVSKKAMFMIFLSFLTILFFSTYILNMKFGFNNYTISYIESIYILILITIIDIKDRVIPLDLIVLYTVIGVVLIYYNPNIELVNAFIGYFGIGSGLYILSKVTKGNIGEGDSLMFASIGLFLGWKMALAILLYSFLFSGVVSIILLISSKVNRNTQLPFAPFVLLALLLIILV